MPWMKDIHGGPSDVAKCKRVVVMFDSDVRATRTVGVMFDAKGRATAWGDGQRLSLSQRRAFDGKHGRGGLCVDTDSWVYWRNAHTVRPGWNAERRAEQEAAAWPGRILKPTALPRLRPGAIVDLGRTRRAKLPLL